MIIIYCFGGFRPPGQLPNILCHAHHPELSQELVTMNLTCGPSKTDAPAFTQKARRQGSSSVPTESRAGAANYKVAKISWLKSVDYSGRGGNRCIYNTNCIHKAGKVIQETRLQGECPSGVQAPSK